MIKEQTYNINDRKIKAIAYFMSNNLVIKENKDTLYECSLNDYTNFTGDMKCFVNKIVQLKDDGLSRSKIHAFINELNTKKK